MQNKESKFLIKWRDSSSVKTFFGCALGVSIITFISMTVCFLTMLFSSGEDGIRYCFFKTIYFESVTNAAGEISMSFGFTGSVLPIIFFFGGLFAFVFGSYYFAKKLLEYRQYLTETR